MAKSAIITLTIAGVDTGPFNLLSDVDSYVTPFETNIPKASLVSGYTTNLVPDAATIVRVQSSSSLCTNFINLTYPSGPTPTQTPTSTPTNTPTNTPTLPPPSPTTLVENLFFDATTGIGGYSVTAITVNDVVPTLTSGTNVPFSTDGHGFSTDQIGTSQTLKITIGDYALNGCIQVTDSALNYQQLPVSGNGDIIFTGLTIDNITTVQIVLTDGVCP